MKNLTVANFIKENKKYTFDSLFTLVRAQIENSLEVGWKREDIIVLSNVEFEHLGVKTTVVQLNDFCYTGSKIFAVSWCFKNGVEDVIWARDLDTWQNVWFDCPDFADIGVTHYSRPKINGGSAFWKLSAIDIINNVIELLEKNKEKREEPTLNRVLKNYDGRVTVLNSTLNIGCSGYVPRYERSEKPIKVVHMHPTNSIAWETHALDRSGVGISISSRLEQLIRRYYPNLAVELSDKGKIRREEKILERLKNAEKKEKRNEKK